jgi:hypothetical protein
MRQGVYSVILCFHFAVSSRCDASPADIFHVSMIGLLCLLCTGFYYFICHENENFASMRDWVGESLMMVLYLSFVLHCRWSEEEAHTKCYNTMYVLGVLYFTEVIAQKCHALVFAGYYMFVSFYVWQIGPLMPVFVETKSCAAQTNNFFASIMVIQVCVPFTRYVLLGLLSLFI